MTDRIFPINTFERLPPHPLATHHSPTAPQEHVDRAAARLRDLIERMGYAEALWVAEELAFEYGVVWNPKAGKLTLALSDLQLIAFASAMRSHHAATFPNAGRVKRDGAYAKERANGGERKKKRRKSSLDD